MQRAPRIPRAAKLANAGVVALVVLALLLLAALLLGGGYAYRQSRAQGGAGALPPCSDTADFGALAPLQGRTPCFQNGSPTNLYYVGGGADYVAAPYGTPPFDVCVGYCSTYKDGLCGGTGCWNGKSNAENFASCMAQLAPAAANCAPPRPVAALGATLYYPLAPTPCICEDAQGRVPAACTAPCPPAG